MAPLVGSYMTELEFLHRPTGTLVLTDAIENFALDRVSCWHLRALMSWAGSPTRMDRRRATCA
jgi:hypothetical protein